MKKQAPLQFKPKKLTLQLLPRTDALYQSICQLGFNPGIQVKFKETKTAAFVVDYLKQRWQPIIKQFNVREVRIYPKKVSFACITHRGWGLSDINVHMASVRREVLSYQIEQGSTGVHHDDDTFHMEYDFVFCDDKPALPFVVSQLTPTSLFEFASPPPKINPSNNVVASSSMVPPPIKKPTTTSSSKSKPQASSTAVAILPQPLTIVSNNKATVPSMNIQPVPNFPPNNSNNRPTNSFITSFAQVSHVLDSMRNVQNATPSSLPNPSQLLIPSLSSTLSSNIGTTISQPVPETTKKDSKKRKNQSSPSKKKKSTQSSKKKKSSKEGEEHHHLAQQTIDSFIKMDKEQTIPPTPLQPTENSGLSQLFHADFSMSLPFSQSTNPEKKRDSSAYSNLELSNFTELFGPSSTTATTTSCKEQSNGIFLDNSQLNLLQNESNGSTFLGPKEKSLTRENTNGASSLLGGTSLQSFASLFA